jgi:antitoxin (DNA-binding transcriptional repressor) of toxin-antitoxin stability system
MLANIYEFKSHFSSYLAQVEAGEVVQIQRRNKPVAELRAIPAQRTELRPMGLAMGQVVIPASFFDPLPDDELTLWNGE